MKKTIQTFHGFPGSNSATRSVYVEAWGGCVDGQGSLPSGKSVFSLDGQPSLTVRPADQVLLKI